MSLCGVVCLQEASYVCDSLCGILWNSHGESIVFWIAYEGWYEWSFFLLLVGSLLWILVRLLTVSDSLAFWYRLLVGFELGFGRYRRVMAVPFS